MDASEARDCLRFLPSVLIQQILKNAAESSSSRWRENKERLSAAFLYLDIFGMQGLVDSLPSETEYEGPERRAAIFAAIFGSFQRLIAIVHEHGGDVVRFTGEGLLVVWPFDRQGANRQTASRAASISACRCALHLLSLNGDLLWSESDSAILPSQRGNGANVAESPSKKMAQATANVTARLVHEREEHAAMQTKLEKLREFSNDSSGFVALNQGGLILMPGDLEDRVLDIVGPKNVKSVVVPAQVHRLSLAAGVGVGDLFAMQVGDADRRTLVVWGEHLAEMVRAVQTHARPGDALTSQDVLAVAPDALGLSSSHNRQHALPHSLLLLLSVDREAVGIDVAAAHEASERAATALVASMTSKGLSEGRIDVGQEVLPLVAGSERALITQSGVAAARAHFEELECTVMVLKLTTNYRTASASMQTQQVIQVVQSVLYNDRHEGSLCRFVQMGHGALVITGFGLPPFTVAPAAAARRALSAACALTTKLAPMGVGCTFGIAAGHICLGCLSSSERIEHTWLGRPVAVAIQLANACTALRPLLVDSAVFQAVKTVYSFEAVRAVTHAGGVGGGPVEAALHLHLIFSLQSTKPMAHHPRTMSARHAVSSWLRSRGHKVPARDLQLSGIAVRELRECFDSLDTAGNGWISLSDLRAALKETSVFDDEMIISALFAKMDKDRSGTVEFLEFLTAIQTFTAAARCAHVVRPARIWRGLAWPFALP